MRTKRHQFVKWYSPYTFDSSDGQKEPQNLSKQSLEPLKENFSLRAACYSFNGYSSEIQALNFSRN